MSHHRATQIAVLGSINMDLVARCPILPGPGATVTATAFDQIPGGKGANQAVAARRAGAEVCMIACLGSDAFGSVLLERLQSERIATQAIRRSESPTGLAMIAVDHAGENQIAVYPGANGLLSPSDVDAAAELIREADTLLVQLEVPLATVLHAIECARACNTRVVLDPAPAPVDPPDALFDVDLICPNRHEASMLTKQSLISVDEVESAARALRDRGARAVAITLGEDGTGLLVDDAFTIVKSFHTEAIDTTACGDAFAGALAVFLSETSLLEAIRHGNAAGALAASKHGAQPAMPQRADILRLVSTTQDGQKA